MSNTTDQKPKGQGWFSRSDLEAKVKRLEAELAAAKAAPVPEAAARLVEQAGRKIANELSADRRAATAPAPVTAEAFRASIAPKSMPRAEFDKLSHSERNAWIKQGGKLHD